MVRDGEMLKLKFSMYVVFRENSFEQRSQRSQINLNKSPKSQKVNEIF